MRSAMVLVAHPVGDRIPERDVEVIFRARRPAGGAPPALMPSRDHHPCDGDAGTPRWSAAFCFTHGRPIPGVASFGHPRYSDFLNLSAPLGAAARIESAGRWTRVSRPGPPRSWSRARPANGACRRPAPPHGTVPDRGPPKRQIGTRPGPGAQSFLSLTGEPVLRLRLPAGVATIPAQDLSSLPPREQTRSLPPAGPILSRRDEPTMTSRPFVPLRSRGRARRRSWPLTPLHLPAGWGPEYRIGRGRAPRRGVPECLGDDRVPGIVRMESAHPIMADCPACIIGGIGIRQRATRGRRQPGRSHR